ncbi:MAG: ATP-binding cassette domain-containing protein [Pseudomonadota bacterium]
MRNEPAIDVRHLNHWFGKGDAKKQALFDINLSVTAGSLTILMGPSGSGKTTLLTLVSCLREVQDGSVNLLGTELRGATVAQQVAMRRRVGFVFQAHNLHDSLTASENVRLGLEVQPEKRRRIDDRLAANHVLGLLGLDDRVDYRPGNLSGGQKQRVAIARALVGNPEIVFGDEPTAALDKESGRNVIKLLKRLGEVRGTTSLIVTHDNRVLDLADRIVTLEDGRLVSDEHR